jgi:hypothetical protein
MAAHAKGFAKIGYERASEPAQRCALGEAARGLLDPHASPADFLDRLMGAGHLADAVRFLAQALPAREAVWWSCLAARLAQRDADAQATGAQVQAAQRAAESWVFQPSEDNRRLAHASAQATDFQSPASWAAMAAFWSGGSMAPPSAPAVPVPAGLVGQAVSAAVILAAVQHRPEQAPVRLAELLEDGLDIARGGNGRRRAAPERDQAGASP